MWDQKTAIKYKLSELFCVETQLTWKNGSCFYVGDKDGSLILTWLIHMREHKSSSQSKREKVT